VPAQLADTQIKFEGGKAFDVGGGTGLCQKEHLNGLGSILSPHLISVNKTA